MVWGLFPVDPLLGEDKYYIFSKGTYKIGRKGCDIIINKDKGVSRIHAEVTFDIVALSSNIRMKDCSKYGTFIRTVLGTKDKVHEFPNKEAVVRDGDVITFGTGAATYRLSFIQLVFFFCPCSDQPLKVDPLVKDEASSFGARVAPTLSEDCTHVLVESHMRVNEDLIDAILAKKPVVLTSWVKLVADKSIRTEIPGYNQYLPSVMVGEALVDVGDPKAREKCLEGYTFVLEQSHKYKFGCRFPPLLKICGADTVSVEELSSNSQEPGYGEISRIICVIPQSSEDEFDGFRKLSSLSRVNEIDLIYAVVSGNLASSVLLPPSVVISSSCSTDETVVADTDTEEETTSHVHMISSTEKVLAPEHVNEAEIKHKPCATKTGDSNATILEGNNFGTIRTKGDGLNELKSLSMNLANTESRGDIAGKPSDSVGDLTVRRERNDEPECGNPDIIYSQDLIVRDLQYFVRAVCSAADGEVVNFKRFRKAKNIPSGNSFSSLIPFSKSPYKEYENGEMNEYMKEEKKRKQMEAIAEDLFNNEKTRKRGMAGSLRGFLTRV